MRKLMMTAAMLAMLPLAALGTADARPLPGDGPNSPDDTKPCGELYTHTPPGGEELLVQDCPLWRGHVPVYALSDDGIEQIGELEQKDGNWFTCQSRFPDRPYEVPGTDYVNIWWASTMADNLESGWVPVAYFAGGVNNQPDGGLSIC